MATTKASLQDQAADILAGIGGADNIASVSYTHLTLPTTR